MHRLAAEIWSGALTLYYGSNVRPIFKHTQSLLAIFIQDEDFDY
jgi:hypothetical protein